MSKVRWAFIIGFFFVILISNFDFGATFDTIMTILSAAVLFMAVCLHGGLRYGVKNIAVLFIITWIVSHFFEALSIQTGFPFGHYYYDKLGGPRIFQVPIIIMFTYFSMGYVSWVLSHVLLRQYSQRLTGSRIFLIPFVATFIMVMWDLCMDPLSSTVDSLWVWKNGGAYFGVPLQNYFGWFLVVYIILQIFALYISKFDIIQKQNVFKNKVFWMEMTTLYGIQGLFQLIRPFTTIEYRDIHASMALITIFTMLFVTLISFIIINESTSSISES